MIKLLKHVMIFFIIGAILFSLLFLVTLKGCSCNTPVNTNGATNSRVDLYDPLNLKKNTEAPKTEETINNQEQTSETATEKDTYSSSNATETITVNSVIDGDTFYYDDFVGVEHRLRLIGVDTPESVNPSKEKNCPYGKTASNYTKSILKSGQEVSIEYDKEAKDIYDRTLAYVYIGDVMLNYDLVAKGYAVAKEYPPNTKYAELFREAQIEAEKNKLGMWSDDVSDEDCNLKEEYSLLHATAY